jgi:hypothetical protein
VKQTAFIVMAVVGICGTLLMVSQLVMACIFAEFGRVFVYLVLAILCVELTVVSIMKFVKRRREN